MERFEGTLREVDLERCSCQVYLVSGECVQCEFGEDHEPVIKSLLDLRIVVTGEAVLRDPDRRTKIICIHDVERIDTSLGHMTEEAIAKPGTGKALLAALVHSGLAGMWKDRNDIGDSSIFARALRERAQKRTGA